MNLSARERRRGRVVLALVTPIVCACGATVSSPPEPTFSAPLSLASHAPSVASTPAPSVASPPPPDTCAPQADPLECAQSLVQAAADRGLFNGEIVVARSGEVVWDRAYGRERPGVAMTATAPLPIASVTKMFTGVAAGQLIDAGKLAYSDRIGEYVEDLPADVAASTFDQLLSHTAGIPMYDWKEGRVHPVGEFHYSNAGFALVDQAIEEISGQPISEYVRRNIVERAGMVDTRFEGAAVLSTARDLRRFADALVANELTTPRTAKTLTKLKVTTDFGGYGYGFGIFEGEAGEAPAFGHIGASPAVVAAVEVSRPIDTTLVVVCIDGFAEIQPALNDYQRAIGMGYWRS